MILRGGGVRKHRRGAGSKRMDWSSFREKLADDRIWTVRGVVHAPDGGDHFSIVRDGAAVRDVLVEVLTVPSRLEITCRLGVGAGGGGGGLWRIPAPGTQVIVDIPDGEVEFYPAIVAVVGAAPERVSDERTILVAAGTLELTADRVVAGPNPEAVIDVRDGFVHGTAVDTLTGLQHWQLGNTSRKFVGNK